MFEENSEEFHRCLHLPCQNLLNQIGPETHEKQVHFLQGDGLSIPASGPIEPGLPNYCFPAHEKLIAPVTRLLWLQDLS